MPATQDDIERKQRVATTGKLIVILAMPRSGTHFLRSALEGSGTVRNVGEPFNPDLTKLLKHSFGRFLRARIDADKSWRFDHRTAESVVSDYLDQLERMSDKAPSLLVIKDDQLRIADWPVTNPARAPRLLSQILQRNYPVLRLARADLLGQYASYQLAESTGRWVETNKDEPADAAAPTLTLEPARAVRHMVETMASDAMIKRWLTGYDRTRRLSYETLIEDGALSDQARDAIAAVTGIVLPPGTVGATKKLAPPVHELVSNLDDVLAACTGKNLARIAAIHRRAKAANTQAHPRPTVAFNGNKGVPFILTNFKRPQNLPRLVDICLSSKYAGQVIVIDNAPDDSLGNSLDLSSRRVVYKPNFDNLGAGYRFTVAARMQVPLVVAIDDDLFPTVEQIDRLIEAARKDPGRLHGIWGERLTEKDNHPHFANAIHNQNRDLDIINRVYVFDPEQAKVARTLMRRTGFKNWLDAIPSDDVFLSFASDRKPRLHDLGPIEDCPTSGAAGIAQWRHDNFIQRRWQVVAMLSRLRPVRQPVWFEKYSKVRLPLPE